MLEGRRWRSGATLERQGGEVMAVRRVSGGASRASKDKKGSCDDGDLVAVAFVLEVGLAATRGSISVHFWPRSRPLGPAYCFC
jgi:hypothetical protein